LFDHVAISFVHQLDEPLIQVSRHILYRPFLAGQLKEELGIFFNRFILADEFPFRLLPPPPLRLGLDLLVQYLLACRLRRFLGTL